MHQTARYMMDYMNTYKQNTLTTTQSGFALIEVMVAVLVLGVGLLGLAGLHAASFRDNQGASLRSQAVYAVNDLADRMRANRGAAIAGNYRAATDPSPGPTPPTPNCLGAVACTPAQMANADLVTWYDFVVASFPGGTATITCVPLACGANAVHTITVSWTGNQSVNNQLVGQQNVTASFTP